MNNTPRLIDLTQEVIREMPGEDSPKQHRYSGMKAKKPGLFGAVSNKNSTSKKEPPLFAQIVGNGKPNIFKRPVKTKQVLPLPFRSPITKTNSPGISKTNSPGTKDYSSNKKVRHISKTNIIADYLNQSSPSNRARGRNTDHMLKRESSSVLRKRWDNKPV